MKLDPNKLPDYDGDPDDITLADLLDMFSQAVTDAETLAELHLCKTLIVVGQSATNKTALVHHLRKAWPAHFEHMQWT